MQHLKKKKLTDSQTIDGLKKKVRNYMSSRNMLF